ncbi:tetratricopeptide repeat protein [Streptomyces sp. NPDC093085]|uniref:tetratricopeptide repeat protein n=1 Tax=Streptomyces sp. NPDC093085 TaxID=3155068 RepID=UPI003441BEBE
MTEHHHHHHAPKTTPASSPDTPWPGPDSVRRPPVGRAPAILRDRDELIGRLKEAVAEGAGGTVFVLHGLGGCGKTAVACALFDHATGERGRLGLWVNASDQASLRAGMLAVAADRGAGDGELMAAHNGLRAAADLVWDHLDRSDRPWLLVLDNADDPAVLRDGGWLRTSPRGTVLVTTRQAAGHWWPAAELLYVGVLPRAEAAQVLCDLAPGTGSAEDAAAIADRLGRLPLALTLAGGFLAHQVIAPWTMAEYGRRLAERPDPIELIDQGATGPDHDARHLVSGTWQLSLTSLAERGLPEAVTLLRLLACWSDAPLPLSLLADARLSPTTPALSLPADRVERALRGLLDRSLTELLPGGLRSVRTHGVLLDSVARTTPPGERDALAATAARVLLQALPAAPERGLRDPRLTALAPHVMALLRRVTTWPEITEATAESAAVCALRLVTAEHRSGDYASALAGAEQATALVRRRLGPDHILVLRLRQRTGKAADRLGHLEKAARLHRELLADLERISGPNSPDTLDTLTTCLHLSRPLTWLGRPAEAVDLMHRAAAGRAALLGPWHPLTLEARACLLELPPGPEVEREAPAGPSLVADCRRELGEDHPVTLAAGLNCAVALFNTARHREALTAARRALAAHERRFGPDYPITQAARSLLSNVLHATGAYPEAIEEAETVREWRERVLGPDHPWTVAIHEKLTRYHRSPRKAAPPPPRTES